MMLFSTARFWALGWIEDHYLNAKLNFKYFGFEWVQVLPPAGMYALHVAMLAGALGVMLGCFYRFSALLFFLTFTYTELIDITYYLNHYYFVSLVSLLLIFVPAHRRFSIDVWRNPEIFSATTPRWTVFIFQLQLAIVYVYAGLAKINHTWLIQALPLRIWLPASDALPVIGPLFKLPWMPWVFSWAGMLYDTTIVFWLLWPKSRPLAYVSVLIFHTMTGLLFQIGVFPLVMIGATWIYFSPGFHERVIRYLLFVIRDWLLVIRDWLLVIGYPLFVIRDWLLVIRDWLLVIRYPLFVIRDWLLVIRDWLSVLSGGRAPSTWKLDIPCWTLDIQKRSSLLSHLSSLLFFLFFAFQLLFPWRYLLYPGNIFWTEEGYRFAWRVMLMEKAGTATFYVKDAQTGREGVVDNSAFLRPHQEKQMAMQPDLILQYAHFLREYYAQQGVADPAVRAEVYVTLNAKPSRLLIDPTVDLGRLRDSWAPKPWILPFE